MAEYSRKPCDSILEARFTVSPKRQYLGMMLPTTPATTGPVFRPVDSKETVSEYDVDSKETMSGYDVESKETVSGYDVDSKETVSGYGIDSVWV